MPDPESLEGWVPVIGDGLTLADVIDRAFDYRGNVTIVKVGGDEVAGYVSNRDRECPQPFIEWFDEEGGGPFKMTYAEIETIRFTGRDTAAGKSWEAWVARREKEERAASQGTGASSGTV